VEEGKMKKLTLALLAITLVFTFGHPAHGKAAKKVAARKVASVRPARTVTRANATLPRPSEKSWDLRLALASGYATTSSNNRTDQQLRSSSGADQNIYFGLAVDLQVKKYYGLELEGFLNSAPEKLTTTNDIVTGKREELRSVQQQGVMAAAKFAYPLQFGFARITPKIGGGYGALGLRETVRQVDRESELQSTLSVRGPFATLGVEVTLFDDFALAADYARTISATGNRSTGGLGTDVASSDVLSPRFERMRVGAYYRIADPFVIGTQYVRRQIRYELPGESVATRETFNQFLGVIMVGF